MSNTIWDTSLGEFVTTPAWFASQKALSPLGAAAQKYGVNSATSTIVLTAADITGGSTLTVLGLTGEITTAEDVQLPTVASVVAAIPGVVAGQTYQLRISNLGGSDSGTFTIVTNTGWSSLSGTMAIDPNTFRDFIVTFPTATTATLQNIGAGVSP